MPKGLMIMRYDNRSGISIEAKYPNEELNMADGTLMNIFSLHEFSQDDGITSMTVGEINVVTYYSGEEIDYYISSEHWLDALTPPLEGHLAKLVKQVSQLLT